VRTQNAGKAGGQRVPVGGHRPTIDSTLARAIDSHRLVRPTTGDGHCRHTACGSAAALQA